MMIYPRRSGDDVRSIQMEPVNKLNVNGIKFKDLYEVVNKVRQRKGLETLGPMAMAIELFYHYDKLEMEPINKRCIEIAERALRMKNHARAPKTEPMVKRSHEPLLSHPMIEERF